jgi:hypothetical protein
MKKLDLKLDDYEQSAGLQKIGTENLDMALAMQPSMLTLLQQLPTPREPGVRVPLLPRDISPIEFCKRRGVRELAAVGVEVKCTFHGKVRGDDTCAFPIF